LDELVVGARRGESASWNALVQRLERVVWRAVHMATSDDQLRQDAFAATWLRLAEHLVEIREPLKLPGWLTTTATNEVRSLVRARRPQDVSIDGWWGADSSDAHRTPYRSTSATIPATDPAPDDVLLRAEMGDAVRRAFAKLSDDCRHLLTILVVSDPPPSYAEVETMLGRPHGSIGPTRRRCLDKLRSLLNEGDGLSAAKSLGR
jgi:RNA polymerase sigma factor (sigma-70 family)